MNIQELNFTKAWNSCISKDPLYIVLLFICSLANPNPVFYKRNHGMSSGKKTATEFKKKISIVY